MSIKKQDLQAGTAPGTDELTGGLLNLFLESD